jgi:predicted DCC family thiol-disulfide oxidoreductase YuxK
MTPAVEGNRDAAGAPVILFDGVCNLCNASVRWVIAHDRAARFRFASLQSRAGRELLAAAGWPAGRPESIVLIEGAQAWGRSDAALGIARRLGFPWSLAAAGVIVPRALRDAVYDWVARNRYRWFGRKDACEAAPPALRGRFLDADEAPPVPSAAAPKRSAPNVG